MKKSQPTVNGITACEEALQRLIDGQPNVAAHINLDLSKLTPSIVSLEAGFDRGYLKKSRKYHLPLIARIQAIRTKAPYASVKQRELEIATEKLVLANRKIIEALEARDTAIRENLYLMRRVKELEKEVSDYRFKTNKNISVGVFS